MSFFLPFSVHVWGILALCTSHVFGQQGRLDQAKKHLPSNEQGVEKAVEGAEKVVAAEIGKKGKGLEELVERARQVRASNAEYMRAVSEGSVQPFARLRERYTHEFPKALSDLRFQYDAIFEEKDPGKQKRLVEALQKALLPIGVYLQPARYGNAKMTLTMEKQAELVRLQELDPRTRVGRRGLARLRVQGDRLIYTMLHLPVHVSVEAQPHSKVYFRTGGGGEFSNGLPLQEVEADKHGVASTSWVSKGDSVGLSVITVTSPECSGPDFLRINVVGLSLRSLPEMPVLKEPSGEVKKKLEALKQSQAELGDSG